MDLVYIDPVAVSPNNYKTVLENDEVRVLEMVLRAGEKDNVHSHPSETVYFVEAAEREFTFPTAIRKKLISPTDRSSGTRNGPTRLRTSAPPISARSSSKASASR